MVKCDQCGAESDRDDFQGRFHWLCPDIIPGVWRKVDEHYYDSDWDDKGGDDDKH